LFVEDGSWIVSTSAGNKTRPAVKVELRVGLPNGGRLGPEDIRLLETIRRERSIIGASRVIGNSYRTCWLMVDALNRTFESPVVETFPGRRGGGAEVTPFGERLIALHETLVRQVERRGAATLAELQAALDPSFVPKANSAEPEDRTPRRPRARSRPS
jgi:molybdate transport system regulatory protein